MLPVLTPPPILILNPLLTPALPISVRTLVLVQSCCHPPMLPALSPLLTPTITLGLLAAGRHQ